MPLAVPIAVFACRMDQIGNAARVAHHGVGLGTTLDRVTEPMLENMISRLMYEREFRMRVRLMSREFMADQKSADAVFLMESVLQGRSYDTLHEGLRQRGLTTVPPSP